MVQKHSGSEQDSKRDRASRRTFGSTVSADVPVRLKKEKESSGKGYHVGTDGDPERPGIVGNIRKKASSGSDERNAGTGTDARSGKTVTGRSGRVFYTDDSVFWCDSCHLPLIGEKCCLCGRPGRVVTLSQPADVRFAMDYDVRLVDRLVREAFGCNPLEGKLLLLNKIPGEDQAMEILVEGDVFGTIRFDLVGLRYVFEPSAAGAKILLAEPFAEICRPHTVVLKKAEGHLNGKNVRHDQIGSFPEEIRAGEPVLIISGNLTGYGIASVSGQEFRMIAENSGNAPRSSLDITLQERQPAVRVKAVSSDPLTVLPADSPGIDDVVKANIDHIRNLGKTAINTIRGFVNLEANRAKPVYVSFSGGKDSLVALDLTKSALSGKGQERAFSAVFLNTGIDFPETVSFVRSFCAGNGINLIEKKAGDAFWTELSRLDHPTKDERWCCKVCKLNSADDVERGNEHISVDGKRRHESFVRATIPASDRNPKVRGQMNIFPIRDWRAIEVWLYIRWRGLDYNPLYDRGFERIGCWMCPAAFQAEYVRMSEIHPELAARWESYLAEWARRNGLKKEYTAHGLWRWKELPPKMVRLCEELDLRYPGAPDRKKAKGPEKKEMYRGTGNKQGRPTKNRVRENKGRR
ncbi:phosphoadenosine phosphosulfate reductase family protein [Methanosarcinaceae archaeon]|nr:phosphoadenosine phosphosulfate reductase family protein [Methanosarcinaceae archaeon]